MKHLSISVILILTSYLTVYSQKLELFGGVNYNIFYDKLKDEGQYEIFYNSKMGYFAGVGLDSIQLGWFSLRFTFQFDQYGGRLEASGGGRGGGFTTFANVEKTVVSLGVYPINFRFFHRLDFNVGFILSQLLEESFDGKYSGWMMYQPNWSYNLQDKYSHYSSKTYFGIQGRVAYDFKLSEMVWISPQYHYYYGLSDEFLEFSIDHTKSMKHYFCISVKMKIK